MAALALVAIALGVHGSSIGQQFVRYNGPEIADPNLLFGEPQGIRSDEWLVTTPLSLAQTRTHFEPVNQLIGDGQNMGLVLDLPQRNLAGLFEPQNWGYFFLDFGRGIAWKWWSLAAMLLISSYYFALPLVGRRTAALLSVSLALSPFVHWWYQTITIAPLAYGLAICALLRPLTCAESPRRTRILAGLGIAYAGTAFALVQYPPFQIPVVLLSAAWYVGLARDDWRRSPPAISNWRIAARRYVVPVVPSVLLSVAITGWVVLGLADQIAIIADAEYPGIRNFASGSAGWQQFWHMSASNLQVLLPDINRAAQYFTNQSEASNFITLWPVLVGVLVIDRVRRRPRSSADSQAVFVAAALVLMVLWLFVDGLSLLFKPTLLWQVPPLRLLLGLGFGQALLLPLFIRRETEIRAPGGDVARWSMVWGFGTLVLISTVLLRERYPDFVNLPWLVILSTVLLLGAAGLMVTHRHVLGVGLLALLGAISVVSINPLYRGADVLTNSDVDMAIRRIGTADTAGRWASIDDVAAENLAFQNGMRTLTGNYLYLHEDFWRLLDPDGSDDHLYDRYMHVVAHLETDDSLNPEPQLELLQSNVMRVTFDPCNLGPLADIELRYLIMQGEAGAPCMELVELIEYPARSFWIYRIRPSS
ncbi:MAG: hypothetical protein O3B65_07550 [Chloroflexi bacterium]|nr:hypothetical protein [Chloroflexota bacterium]